MTETPPSHYACVGIGAGPANLSLASLLHGLPDAPSLFLDRKRAFGWHDGQLVDGATLQVSMLKDLVTLADPTSPFSFLAYLHDRRRIYHYINARFESVPRQEFRDYLHWASERNPNVVFGEEVRAVEFDGRFVVRTSRRTVTADNVAVGVGSTPWVPEAARPWLGPTQFHVSEFTAKACGLAGKRVCVVGGGQSGAEAFLDLLSRPEAELPRRVSWVSRRPNFLPIDDSPFVNDYYMPGHAEHFFGLAPEVRAEFNRRQVLSSDGVSESTLRSIYQRIYLHRMVGGAADLVALHPHREVGAVRGGELGGWELSLTHNDPPGRTEQLEADVVVWATGFRPAATDFLAPLADRLTREGGEYVVDEDFAARWDGPRDRNLFLLNAARGQWGLADANLSLIAWRSQRVIDRLRGTRTDSQLPSFIEWSAKPPADEPRGA